MSDQIKLLLCIEDDEDDCAWIHEAAIEVDPDLIFVHKENGKQAMWFLNELKANSRYPCLILLDINMPIMDGKETLAAIKSDPKLKQIPVVVFTTSNSKADQQFCELHGAEFISKPEKVAELKKKVNQVVMARCA